MSTFKQYIDNYNDIHDVPKILTVASVKIPHCQKTLISSAENFREKNKSLLLYSIMR